MEFERVDTDRDWSDKAVVQFLIEFFVAGGGDVDETPLEVCERDVKTYVGQCRYGIYI